MPLDLESARWLEVLTRLGDWFEERKDNFANLPAYEAELDHLEVWQGHAARMSHGREAVRMLWLRAYPHYHRGQFRHAHDLVLSALTLYEEACVVDLKLEAHLRNDLAIVLGALGDHRKALDFQQRALDIRCDIIGEKHSDTAIAINNVGFLLAELGEHRKALEYAQRALGIQREVLGEKHPDTARSLNNVGSLLGELGDHRKALKYKQRALDIRREVLGEKHPDTARAIDSVGGSLGELGDHRKALEYKQRALDIHREILGEKHPDTAKSLNNVGVSLEAVGEFVKAIQHWKMALAVLRDALGDRHPHTILTWENVVTGLLHHRKKAEALMLVENDLKKFPHNATLKRLKSEILGKKTSAKAPGRPTASSKKAKPPKR